MISDNSPNGWVIYPNDAPNLQFDFWKAYPTPDGLEVDVCILKFQNTFQIKTEASSRSAVSTQVVVAEVGTLDEAKAAAFQECRSWDEFVLKQLKKPKWKPAQVEDPNK